MGFSRTAAKDAATQRPGAEHVQWLRAFAAAVRDRDIDAGRALCERGIHSFGTVCWRSENLDMLVRDQWENIWPKTHGFDFDYDTVRAVISDDIAALLTTWTSQGADDAGHSFPRRGRATIILRRTGDAWKAVHTHFSMDPTG